ncbi:MAG: hypothetical protein ACTSPB_09880, partial [Candidatus Thorarchaeota archaeon]
LGNMADYVIPLSLSESSPLGLLIRLGLVEGATDGKLKPTRLGRAANRLYLSIPTVREILALLPMTNSSSELLWLLRHVVAIESGMSIDESFDNLIGSLVTTDISVADLATQFGLSIGDVYGLLDTSRWLLRSISVLSELGGLARTFELSQGLADVLDKRFSSKNEEDD